MMTRTAQLCRDRHVCQDFRTPWSCTKLGGSVTGSVSVTSSDAFYTARAGSGKAGGLQCIV